MDRERGMSAVGRTGLGDAHRIWCSLRGQTWPSAVWSPEHLGTGQGHWVTNLETRYMIPRGEGREESGFLRRQNNPSSDITSWRLIAIPPRLPSSYSCLRPGLGDKQQVLCPRTKPRSQTSHLAPTNRPSRFPGESHCRIPGFH